VSPVNRKAIQRTVILKFIKVARAAFFNTWVHQLPITNYIYKKVFGSLYRDQPEDIVAFQGHRFHLKTDDITIVPSMLNGTYETNELGLFRSLLRPGMRVVDVGANIGMYSVIGSAAVGPTGSVVAFEKTNFAFLERNLAENGCGNVVPIQAAVGSRSGKIQLYLKEGSIGTHSMGRISEQSTEVDIVTLDDKLLDGAKVDVIKTDVEGYEEAVLDGMKKVLERDCPIVLMEFNAGALALCGTSPTAFLDKLWARFRHMYLVRSGPGGLLELDARGLADLKAKGFGTINLVLTSTLLRGDQGSVDAAKRGV
jgi:FkbM family methyltransferase